MSRVVDMDGEMANGNETRVREGIGRGRVEVMGVPFDPVTEREAIDRILSALAAGKGGAVITPNLDIVRQMTRDPGLLELVQRAELSLVDGTTLVWASRLQGTPLPARVTGASLVFSLTEAAAPKAGVFLLGGNPKTAEKAAAALSERFPGLRIVGTHCPPMSDFAEGSREVEEIRRVLAEAKPDIVFVGLGFPKQEKLIEKLRSTLPGAWFLGVGIGIGIAAGEISRAPGWMQAAGLEWFFRMMQEPERLFRRFVILGIPFSLRLFAEALRERLSSA
ncbi:MAG: WecB/TagA/CpsF family glycosyltransferase [Polyangiaceae bacterium]|nr:WecB/TagA/CpsF family glycosyltransferase [Polyangiaceae bacterium]